MNQLRENVAAKLDAKVSTRATQASIDALLATLGDANNENADLESVMNALRLIVTNQMNPVQIPKPTFGFVHDMRGFAKTELAWRTLTNTPVTFTCAEAFDCGDFITVFGMANTTAKVVYNYNPFTDSWQKLPDAPDLTYRCHAVKCGEYIYLASTYASPYTKFYRFHPLTWAWEQLPDMPTPMATSSGILVSCGTNVYAIGGGSSAYYRTLRRFDTMTETWNTLGLANAPFDVNGGNGWEYGDEFYILHASTAGSFAKYTPWTNTWKVLATCPAPCSKTARGVLNGKLLLAGGDVNSYAYAWQYDPASDTWSRIADNYHSMSGGCGATCMGKFYVFGTNYGYSTSSKAAVFENPMDSANEQIVAQVIWGQEIYYNVYGGYGFLSLQNVDGTYTEIPKGKTYVSNRNGLLKSNMYSASGILRGWVKG